jgi:hypothetical protein
MDYQHDPCKFAFPPIRSISENFDYSKGWSWFSYQSGVEGSRFNPQWMDCPSHIGSEIMQNKKPTMFEAAKKVMGIMEQLTARQIIVRLKDNGRKEVPTPRQLAQRFRTDQQINVIKSRSKKDETIFQKITE